MPKERPESWEETWANAFEEGFYDNLDGAQDPKTALVLETDAQGRQKVVGVATGADAERLIAEAEASGVEIRRDADQVEHLLQEQSGATDVPAEIYALMSTLLEFATELSQEWAQRDQECLPRAAPGSRDIEYGHEAIEPS